MVPISSTASECAGAVVRLPEPPPVSWLLLKALLLSLHGLGYFFTLGKQLQPLLFRERASPASQTSNACLPPLPHQFDPVFPEMPASAFQKRLRKLSQRYAEPVPSERENSEMAE